jgi:lipoprotein-releasing system ATP-binding protein
MTQSASPQRAPLLRLEGVSKVFGTGDYTTRVLERVDLVLRAGETLAVLGPSGSGKSTLLDIVGSLEPPTEGRVLFEGRDLATLDETERARLRNSALGFVFQHHYLLPQLTALETVLVPSLAAPRARSERAALQERAEALLERVGLAERRLPRPSALSGGERQRVAVVRALLLEPRLVLADEPTGSLDARSAEVLGDVLAEASVQDGAALLVVTHSERLAERMGGRVTLTGGTLVGAARSQR